MKPNKTVTLGGSKSYTNRALFISALTAGDCVIENASESNDSKVLIAALNKLALNKKVTLNARDAGTAFRFLTALASLTEKEIVLTGTARMQQRPVGELVEALNKLGANISYIKKPGFPPLKILPGDMRGGAVSVDGGISSQFLSALLMLGPVLPDGLRLKIKGRLVSASYVDMTLAAMRAFGAQVSNKNYKEFAVKPAPYKKTKFVCEADASGASYFWAMAALSGGKITVKNISPKSAQGDVKFASLMAKMGAKVAATKNTITVQGTAKLKPINADMTLMPDTAQTLAVVCAFAPGKSKITGLKTLRIKETDRISALQKELAKMGIKTKAGAEYIEIYGGAPRAAKIKTYDDHRMAMSFAIAATRLSGMKIENPGVVKKSFPDFWVKFKELGLKL